MLIEIDRGGIISCYSDENSARLSERDPEKRIKENKENLFVTLFATGQYGSYKAPDKYPYRVDQTCSLGELEPYLIIGREAEWLEYSYKIKPDTSNMVWGEGMYEEWKYDFSSIAYESEYWKQPKDKQHKIIKGTLELICNQGSWFVSLNSFRIHMPGFYGWL